MHKGAKFRQIGDAKQLVCMRFLKKQSRRRQDMKTIITEVKKKKTNTSQRHVLYMVYMKKNQDIIDTR